MKTPEAEPSSLWSALKSDGGDFGARFLCGPKGSVRLAELSAGSSLGSVLESLRGRSVLLATKDQLAAALVLIELDGIARRMVLCPPGVPPAHLAAIEIGRASCRERV